MTPSSALAYAFHEQLSRDRRDGHARLLALAEDLTDDQLRRRLGPHAPGIGFHLWHVARWEDYDRSIVDSTPQIWMKEGLRQGWGMTGVALGEEETGTQMGDDASDHLILPGRPLLLGYVRSVFEAMDDLLAQLPVEKLLQVPHDSENHAHLLGLLAGRLTHVNRHLGMIEALRGLLDLQGTATR